MSKILIKFSFLSEATPKPITSFDFNQERLIINQERGVENIAVAEDPDGCDAGLFDELSGRTHRMAGSDQNWSRVA